MPQTTETKAKFQNEHDTNFLNGLFCLTICKRILI
jgi:hypothetical protein